MTIQEFKRVFGYLNIKFKKVLPDDYIITNEDIIKGSIVQKYVYSNNFTSAINGFTIIENEICYIYNNIDKIEIDGDEIFPPCGGKMKVNVYAIYSIHKVDSTGNDVSVETNKRSKVSAIIKLDNSEFTYDKPFIVKETPNTSDKNKECNINVTYYNNAKKYVTTKHFEQTINTVSSWLLESEPTTSIELILSKENVGNEGGIVTANVKRHFTRLYHMIDSCGNEVGGKSEPGHVEDITHKCLFSSSDKKNFTLSGNVIRVKEQEIGAKARSSIIAAKFFGFSSSVELHQSEGGKVSYKYDLSFDDESVIKFLDLETSLKKEVRLPIISKKNIYIDDVYKNSVNTKNLKITSDSEWIYGYAVNDSENIILVVNASEPNLDKENDREATILITNNEDESKHIKLIVSQSALETVNEEIYCVGYGSGEYTSEELDDTEIYFKTFKRLEYENGEIDVEEYNIEKPFVAYQKSTNSEFLDVINVKFTENKYVIYLDNASKYSKHDINLKTKLIFDKDGIESDTIDIKVSGNAVDTHGYELCFEGHEKFKNVVWNKNKNEIQIPLTSIKTTIRNDKVIDTQFAPLRVVITDDNGKEYFDDSFSIRISDGKLFAFPYKVKKSVSKVYTLIQVESGLRVTLKLDYEPEKVRYNVNLKVLLCAKTIKDDIWTGEGGYLLIDKKDKIMLNPCWVSPKMTENFDVAFDGMIWLTEGEHAVEAFNLTCKDKVIKLKDKIRVNKVGEPIILSIYV